MRSPGLYTRGAMPLSLVLPLLAALASPSPAAIPAARRARAVSAARSVMIADPRAARAIVEFIRRGDEVSLGIGLGDRWAVPVEEAERERALSALEAMEDAALVRTMDALAGKLPDDAAMREWSPEDPGRADLIPKAERTAAELAAPLPAEVLPRTLWEHRRASGLRPFKNVVIDVRNSRGGKGDVAAGYLTAADILAGDAPADARVTLLMDGKAEKILAGLRGRPAVPGQADFGGRLLYHTVESLPAAFPAADLYMLLASALRSDSTARAGRLIGSETVVIEQSVLGRTEARSTARSAVVQARGQAFVAAPAGLAPGETGVYSDHAAWELRGKSRDEVARFIAAALPLVASERDRLTLRRMLDGTLLPGAEPGLAYGISAAGVKGQFEGYMKALAGRAGAEGKSYVLLSPSGFSKEDIQDPALRARVEVVAKDDAPPAGRAEPGKIYVVLTGDLPHPVFVGLMAYSRPPPVVAGDGAMSAGVILGRPFAMTRVAWNARNIGTFRERLLESDSRPGTRELLAAVFDEGSPDLGRALELDAHAAAFEGLARSVPSLTASLLDAAQAAIGALQSEAPAAEVLAALPADTALRAGFLLRRLAAGETAALALLAGEYARATSGWQREIRGALRAMRLLP